VALGEGSSDFFFESRSTGSSRSVGPASQLRREPALVAIREGLPNFFLNLGRQATAGVWGPLVSLAESRPSWLSAKGRPIFLI
jgi:hypothetical protein